MHVVQILPALNEGGVERGTVEFSRELVKRGHRSTVISSGGKLAGQIVADGGEHITLCHSGSSIIVACHSRAIQG